ncbi:MAG: hypothetical protein JXA30_23200 [Deltaproteobacteria bacterium]|nr:hypothetical protein [Deltaproteobacteria bacterium]
MKISSPKVLLYSILLVLLLLGCNKMRKSSAGDVDAGELDAVPERGVSGQGDKPTEGGIIAGESEGSDQRGQSNDGGTDAGESEAAFNKDSSDRDATVEPVPEGSPCGTPVYQMKDERTLDLSLRTTLLVCLYELGATPDVVRVDVEGIPVCENLAKPCEEPWTREPCTHECESDSDCPAGNVCICEAGAPPDPLDTPVTFGPNRCVQAECTGAADCGGWACGMSSAITEWVGGVFFCQGPIKGFFCRSSIDECSSDLDCDSGKCYYDSINRKWVCKMPALCD